MGDVCDKADAAIEASTDDALRRARGKSAPESHPDFDGTHCLQCDEVIPRQRLKLGKIFCVGCQTIIERKRT